MLSGVGPAYDRRGDPARIGDGEGVRQTLGDLAVRTGVKRCEERLRKPQMVVHSRTRLVWIHLRDRDPRAEGGDGDPEDGLGHAGADRGGPGDLERLEVQTELAEKIELCIYIFKNNNNYVFKAHVCVCSGKGQF